MPKLFKLIVVLTLFVASPHLASLRAEPINSLSEQMVLKYGNTVLDGGQFKLFKVYGDLETDDVQPWMQPYNGRCNEKCQTEFNKCVESQSTKRNCDASLYKITGVIGYEFPCGANEIWLMQFSSACTAKSRSNPPGVDYSGQIACIASDIAKRCEVAGDGCAADCKNSSKIDRDLGVYIPTATQKQRGIARPGLNSLDIRRD